MADAPASPTSSERAADRAAGNAAVRAAAELVARLASLALLFALARTVGPAGLGVFVLAMAWVEIANLPVEMGFDRYLSRQVARDRANVERLLLNVLAAKALRAGPVLGVSVLLAYLVGYAGGQREAILVAMIAVIFDSFGRSVMAVFVGLERGGLAASILVSQRLLSAALGLAAVALGMGVVTVLAGYAVSTVAALGFALVLMRRHLGPLRLDLSREGRREAGRHTTALAAQEVFAAGIARADAVLLSLLGTTVAVGQYGAAYRLMESTLFIPLALTTAFTAMFTYLSAGSQPTVRAAYEYALKAVVALLLPCSVALAILPGPLLELLFGAEFRAAVGPLRLLAPVVSLLGIVIISNTLVISRRDPGVVARAFGVALVVNVAANVALIGPLGASGAAAGMLLTEALFAVAMLHIAGRTVGRPRLRRVLAGPAIAATAMGLVLAALPAPVLLAIALGGAVYGLVLVGAERLLHPDDVDFARRMVRRRLARRGMAAPA